MDTNDLMMMLSSDLLYRISDKCFKKCVVKHGEGDLHPGEGICLERCTYKYMEVYKIIGQIIQEQQDIQREAINEN